MPSWPLLTARVCSQETKTHVGLYGINFHLVERLFHKRGLSFPGFTVCRAITSSLTMFPILATLWDMPAGFTVKPEFKKVCTHTCVGSAAVITISFGGTIYCITNLHRVWISNSTSALVCKTKLMNY